MFLIDIIRRSSRSLGSAKTRTILTSFALAVGAFALTITLGASNGAQSYADQIVADNFDPSELIISGDDSLFSATDSSKPKVYDQSFGSITSAGGIARQVKMLGDNDIRRFEQTSGVESVRPAISVSLQYITRDGQKKYVGTILAYSAYKTPELLAGTIPTTLANNEVVLPEAFLQSLGFKTPQDAIGKNIRFSVQKQFDQSSLLSSLSAARGAAGLSAQSGERTSTEEIFKVVAIEKKPGTLVQPGAALNLKVSKDAVAKLNDYTTEGTANYHKYLTAYVKVKDGGSNVSKLDEVQKQIKQKGYGVQSVIDTQQTITQVITVLQGIVTVFGAIAVIASVFGVVNTMYISVLQRTREIGLMKALGMHKSDISRLFLFEAALIGIIGGVVGSALAIAVGTLLNPTISKQLGLGSQRLIEFQFNQIAVLLVALTLIAIIAGLLPARKASKLDPIEALRTE